MSEERARVLVKGYKHGGYTTVTVDGVVIDGVESITIEYAPNGLAVATIKLGDFDIIHKGGDDE